MSETELMGVTAYARHRGCDLKTVIEACEANRISYIIKGTRKLIDPKEADVEWERNTDQKFNPKNYVEDKQIKTKAPPFQESRAVREAYNARITKLEYEQKRGSLIEKEKVKNQSANTSTIIKNNLRQIPIKIAAEIASETDPHKIEMLLLKEIDEALEELSRYAERY